MAGGDYHAREAQQSRFADMAPFTLDIVHNGRWRSSRLQSDAEVAITALIDSGEYYAIRLRANETQRATGQAWRGTAKSPSTWSFFRTVLALNSSTISGDR